MQKWIVLLLFCLLLEFHSTCLRVLTSSLCHSCSVNNGIFLVTRFAALKSLEVLCADFSSGEFLFVSVIAVILESLLQAPKGMALKHALVWLLSAFGLDTSVFCLFLDALGIVGLGWLPKQVQCLGVERSSLFQFAFWGHSVLLVHLFLTCLATCYRCITD